MKKTLVLLLALLLFVLPLSGALASVSLPAGLKAIEAEAFEGDSAFTGVVELPAASVPSATAPSRIPTSSA